MLPDIQDQVDERGIALDRVGIAGVRYPSRFRDGATDQRGIATFEMTVTLPGDRRGTHMSRMVEIIHDHLQVLDPRELPVVLKTAAARLEVEAVGLNAVLPIASLVTSPISGRESWQPSDLKIAASWAPSGSRVDTSVTSEVTSLCPCSKAISDYGAHNQRSSVTLTLSGFDDDPYPVDVARAIDMIRSVGSCPIFPLIKRPDERQITMQAFDHPAFVEDMVRDLSTQVREQGVAHAVEVRNFESIHSHDAVASVTWTP